MGAAQSPALEAMVVPTLSFAKNLIFKCRAVSPGDETAVVRDWPHRRGLPARLL